jgi:hypothetical protein
MMQDEGIIASQYRRFIIFPYNFKQYDYLFIPKINFMVIFVPFSFHFKSIRFQFIYSSLGSSMQNIMLLLSKIYFIP